MQTKKTILTDLALFIRKAGVIRTAKLMMHLENTIASLTQYNTEVYKDYGALYRAKSIAEIRANAEIAKLRAALKHLLEACELADADGELNERIDGELMEQAHIALGDRVMVKGAKNDNPLLR